MKELKRAVKTNERAGYCGKICPTETESAQRLLPYNIDIISVHNGLKNITCIVLHIINQKKNAQNDIMSVWKVETSIYLE